MWVVIKAVLRVHNCKSQQYQSVGSNIYPRSSNFLGHKTQLNRPQDCRFFLLKNNNYAFLQHSFSMVLKFVCLEPNLVWRSFCMHVFMCVIFVNFDCIVCWYLGFITFEVVDCWKEQNLIKQEEGVSLYGHVILHLKIFKIKRRIMKTRIFHNAKL